LAETELAAELNLAEADHETQDCFADLAFVLMGPAELAFAQMGSVELAFAQMGFAELAVFQVGSAELAMLQMVFAAIAKAGGLTVGEQGRAER
jgi:hypothetical protein